jgi:hypothetical protein
MKPVFLALFFAASLASAADLAPQMTVPVVSENSITAEIAENQGVEI